MIETERSTSASRSPHVAIVGAGPAGLIAADRLSELGCHVVLYERMASPARKLLMAGRGGLNLTHSEPLESLLTRYRDADPRLAAAVRAFPPAALLAWVHGLGIETFVGSSGRVFPNAMKASPLLRSLLARLSARGVELRARHRFVGWDDDGTLRFETPSGVLTVQPPDATLLALGGASWPRLGADGTWVGPLAARGIAITRLAPSNCGVAIAWSAAFRARFQGQPLKRIAMSVDGGVHRGEAIVTRAGLEGGPVYALGPELRAALARQGSAGLAIDLRPDLDTADLARRLARPRAKQSAATYLRKTAGLPAVAIGLLRESTGGPLPHDADALAGLIKSAPLTVTGLAGMERAISTAGGVRLAQLDEQFMIPHMPGVFLAGEMLDWDAPTGGYLLQACFSTAIAAAEGIRRWLAPCQSAERG